MSNLNSLTFDKKISNDIIKKSISNALDIKSICANFKNIILKNIHYLIDIYENKPIYIWNYGKNAFTLHVNASNIEISYLDDIYKYNFSSIYRKNNDFFNYKTLYKVIYSIDILKNKNNFITIAIVFNLIQEIPNNLNTESSIDNNFILRINYSIILTKTNFTFSAGGFYTINNYIFRNINDIKSPISENYNKGSINDAVNNGLNISNLFIEEVIEIFLNNINNTKTKTETTLVKNIFAKKILDNLVNSSK